MRQNLSLAQLKIAEPCSQDWDTMSGDAQKKFCEGCQKHVHNLSAMTLSAAEQLLCESAGRLCVRYDFNPDGSVKTLDYAPAPVSRRGWKFWTVIGAGLATLVAGAQAVTTPAQGRVMGQMKACPMPTTLPATMPSTPQSTMGDVSVSDPNLPTTRPDAPPPIMGELSLPACPVPGPTTQSAE